MLPRLTQIAAKVIASSGKDLPVDTVLRSELKGARGLARGQSTEITRAVFSYYRWKQWLDAGAPPATQLAHAENLAHRFAENPASFSEEELRAKAIPAWISSAMETPAEWLRALQSEPMLWLRARAGRGDLVALELGDCRPSHFPELPDALSYTGPLDLFRTPAFQAGDFELQDIASQAVGILCGPKPGETWWDACSGEGGKTLHLSDLMQNKGLLWATDRAEWRLRNLKRRAARAKAFNYRTALWTSPDKLPTKTRFDGVLLDAPCSGIGTWQRNPHARWTTSPLDVEELAEVQRQLLSQAATLVKPGGKLIYSVCTLSRKETEGVERAFSELSPEFHPLPLTNPFNRASGPAAAQLWHPHQTGGNGMFVAAWRRKG